MSNIKSRLATIFFLLAGWAQASSAAKKVFHQFELGGKSHQVHQLASKQSNVWGMEFLGPNTILFTKKFGKLALLNLKTNSVTPLNDFPFSTVKGQGGLMDVAKSPNFAKDKTVYVTYTKEHSKGYTTALAKSTFDGAKLGPFKEIFAARTVGSGGRHFGSRIAFDGKGHLFLTVGDRGERKEAQDLSNHNGTVLRLDLNGTSLPDNPFAQQEGALPEIWSYGHRNPQGILFDKKTKQLVLHEHGPRGGDEINVVKKARNYGWPTVSFGREYISRRQVGEGTEKAGMENPIKQYTPSIAPSGFALYRGSKLPAFDGHFLLGSLALLHLNKIRAFQGPEEKDQRLLENLGLRIREVIQGPDEWIYFATDTGEIYRITQASTK